MISEKDKLVWIITYDLRINQTSTYRYFSFLNSLNESQITTIGLGIYFPFKPHPNTDQTKNSNHHSFDNCMILEIDQLNLTQSLLYYIDKAKTSFSIKKIFLALHIILYKVDQWFVKPSNFKNMNAKPSIIVSGGSGGIIKTSYLLSKKYNAKLILDYRDPWNFGYNLLETNNLIHFFKRKFTLKTEIKILEYAHHITTVSESLKNFFPKKYHHKITVIENGSNFEQKDIVPQINPTPAKFSINYLGTIYNDQLFEDVFFEAFSDFYRNIENKHQISLNFIGADKNENLKKMIKKYNLEGITNITKRVNKEDLMPYLTDASIFLQLRFKGRSEIITSKITDYLMFRKPILLPVTDEGDIAEAIRKYNAGYVCNGAKETLNALYSEYTKFLNKKDCRINMDKDLSQISRTEVSKKLIDIINNLEN